MSGVLAGRMNDRITILNFTTERLPSGQVKESWLDGQTIWAEVRGISGREMMASESERAESTIRVWVRFRDDITAASRLRCESGAYKNLVLDIVSPPVPDMRNDRLEILCKQGVKT